MMLDHEGLDVHQLALDFLDIANTVIEGFPRGRSHLADQFTRASLSIVLNMAEGAGKHSKPDKRRLNLLPLPLVPMEHICSPMDSAFFGHGGGTGTLTGRTIQG